MAVIESQISHIYPQDFIEDTLLSAREESEIVWDDTSDRLNKAFVVAYSVLRDTVEQTPYDNQLHFAVSCNNKNGYSDIVNEELIRLRDLGHITDIRPGISQYDADKSLVNSQNHQVSDIYTDVSKVFLQHLYR